MSIAKASAIAQRLIPPILTFAQRVGSRCLARHAPRAIPLPHSLPRATLFPMRALALLLVAVAVGFGIYELYLKRMPVSDQGTASTQAIRLTGVRMDLLQIAQAERSFIALNGRCASIDELISSHSLTMSHPERDGYTYTLECGVADFTATARHPDAPEGSPIRYPALAVDQSMSVHEVN